MLGLAKSSMILMRVSNFWNNQLLYDDWNTDNFLGYMLSYYT